MQQSPNKQRRHQGDWRDASKGKPKYQEERVERAKATPIVPMNDKQKLYLEYLQTKSVVIATGYAGCVDKDTEFLSQNGWKKISEYTATDLVMQVSQIGLNAGLVAPLKYVKQPCSLFYHFKNDRGIDQMLSDDHNVAYTIKNKTKLNKKLVFDILNTDLKKTSGFLGKIPTVYNYSGNSLNLSEYEIRLGVAIKADAHLATESTGKYVFKFKKERKYLRLLDILNQLSKKYTESYNVETEYYTITIYAPEHSKLLSDWMFCSRQDAIIIMSEYQYWDGDSNPVGNRLPRFSTANSKEADAMQYFSNICGYRASISEVARSFDFIVEDKTYHYDNLKLYVVNVTEQTHLKLTPINRLTGKILEPSIVKSEDGFKYCFEVPSGFLILRRNGKVFVTGNTSKTYLATKFACNEYLADRVYKIAFSRPAISNSKSLGFFAGDKNEKMEIWLAPVLSTVKETLNAETTALAIKREDILFYPLEVIKGLSLGSNKPDKKLWFIVDEAEDLTKDEVIKIVTRIGKNATLVLAGDILQSELKDNSGLKWLIEFVARHKMDNFGHIDFNHVNDIVRSDTVKKFITCLERDKKDGLK